MLDDLVATIPADKPYSFESQARQYPKVGPPGLDYFAGEVEIARLQHPSGAYVPIRETVDCLLYRNSRGAVIGILNHYPVDMPPYEQAGNVNIYVHPRRRRRGVGSTLLREARRRWGFDATQQSYTEAGLALIRHVLEQEEGP